ncbi:MAG: hypothetical protein NTV21_12375 [Planctomycetota bacterium]|nr:hypothetical protein [Planctomycetota bacterium]
MKPITLHPSSLLVGVGLTAIAFVSMAQSPQLAVPTLARPSPQALVRPQDMVRIREGTPFTVPANKWFVVTALGTRAPAAYSTGSASVELRVNGVAEMKAFAGMMSDSLGGDAIGNGTSMREVPRGFSVPSGSVIEVLDLATFSPVDAEVWGYLADG